LVGVIDDAGDDDATQQLLSFVRRFEEKYV
jgi:hypothetical protein